MQIHLSFVAMVSRELVYSYNYQYISTPTTCTFLSNKLTREKDLLIRFVNF